MSSIKHLLPPSHRYFKANLHTHTTISDGKLSPVEVKEMYKQMGYQILAITDHNIVVDHSTMTEPDFLMLTGMELNYNHANYRPWFDGQSYHFNLIAKEPHNVWSPWKANGKYAGGLEYEKLMECEGMDMRHEVDITNEMIAKANEKGFLVMYKHPTWSCHSYNDYAPLKGLWGMELRNGECVLLGNNENNARVWKDLMNLGNTVFPVGADDMHTPRAAGTSWIMVGAEKLEYSNVIDALEKGDFYMSCGPEIFSLTVEGNILKITCSEARQIILESHGRFARRAAKDDGTFIQEAAFDLTKFFEKADSDSMYLHLTVTAPDGTYAATRAYYLNELVSR